MAGFVLYIFAVFPFGFSLLPAVDGNSSTLSFAVVAPSSGSAVTTATASSATVTNSSSVSSANNSIGNDTISVAVSTVNQSSQAQTTTIRPSPSQSVQATSTVIPSAKPSTEGTAIWDKAIDLATPMGTFIIVIVALALVLILLIVLIWVCCKYNNLKTRTKFPNNVSINDADHHWIQSNDDLLMWERNLRASEVNSNGRGISNRPYNEKRK